MITCRSIPTEIWEHARAALVFYFTRRHGLEHAEDLAQETLTALWNRPDYEFEHKEDFLRVCYGFADNISKAGYRRKSRREQSLEGFSLPAPETRNAADLNAVEMTVCLNQVFELGKAGLRSKDWQLIRGSLELERTEIGDAMGIPNANNVRVRLHRAIRKLAKLAAPGKDQL
jgi:RNA polymerase sigma factor (sigma-70 family)